MNRYLEEYVNRRDWERITADAVAWIRDWFAANGPASPAVIGISGGKDSTVTAALCVRALGAERVFGVMMPNGIQPDISYSRRVTDLLGIGWAEVNISDAYRGVVGSLRDAPTGSGEKLPQMSPQALINLSPRLRMATLYAVSQTLGGRVSNNGNRSERYVGYMTVWGDTAGDFAPLAGLTVTEVRLIGACLGLPADLTGKPPSDGLTGKTDEDNLGFTYEDLDSYILTGHCDPATKELIDRRHRANLFKLAPIASFKPE